MNIFILSWNIQQCVEAHFDKHVVKMILELAQLLSITHFVLKSPKYELWRNQGLVYKAPKSHINHPCAIWTRQHRNNYMYTCLLAQALCREYFYRYGQYKNYHHKSEKIINHCYYNEPIFPKCTLPLIGIHKVTKPAQAMPDKYKHKNTIEAYRNWYRSEEKSHITTWKDRKQPSWF
jgi:hypothetical protein